MRTLLTRLAHMLFVLWVVATILFFLFRLMPGDPTVAYIDTNFTEEQVAQLKRTFGLDRPLHEQYVTYLKNLAVGEFGDSFHHRRPVIEVLASVLPNTIVLTLTGADRRLHLRRAGRRVARLAARQLVRGGHRFRPC